MVNKCTKKYTKSLINREMQINTTRKYQYPIRMAKLKRLTTSNMDLDIWSNHNFTCTVLEMSQIQPLWGKNYGNSL